MNQIYVGFWRRFWAYLVDSFIAGILFYLFGDMLKIDLTSTSSGLFMFAVVFLYFIIFWSSQDGQTIGARLFKFKVVKEGGLSMSFFDAIVRYVGMILSYLPLCIGLIWAAFDKKKQGWHDKLARTVVVETGKPNLLVEILSVIFGFIAFIAVIFFVTSRMATSGFKNLSYTGNTNILSEEVFEKSNNYRETNGLSKLESESRLCAYAQRRLEQLNNLGKNDDGKGFYEDISDPQIVNAYFSNYKGLIGSNMMELDAYTKAQGIVDSWWNAEKSNLKEKTYTNGCVRADSKFLVFILAAK